MFVPGRDGREYGTLRVYSTSATVSFELRDIGEDVTRLVITSLFLNIRHLGFPG